MKLKAQKSEVWSKDDIIRPAKSMKRKAARNEHVGSTPPRTEGLSYEQARAQALAGVEKYVWLEEQFQNDSFHTLTSIYVLHKAGLENPEEHKAFLTASGINPDARREGTTDEYLTVKACFHADDWVSRSGKISQWAKGLQVLSMRGIPASDVSQWLRKSEDINGDGKPVKGIAKVLTIHAREAGKASPQDKRTERLAAFVKERKEKPLFVVPGVAGGGPENQRQLWLVLTGQSNQMVLAVQDKPEIIDKLPLSLWEE